jgi:tetratricopeptide (TPR) repeat protein
VKNRVICDAVLAKESIMKVFLSSTYNDLIEHRRAAHDALEQLGLHVIWMESFGARPEDSTKACLKEVEESDLFVGIYAHRYGYIPKDSAVSITEQEFDHAQKLSKPIFGFIVNEEHPWSPRSIEHDKETKLDAFLGKVKKKPVEFFTTPDHLANNIASSVGHYLVEHKPIPDSRFPVYRPPKPTGSTLPQQPFFVGREKELKIIKFALAAESRTWGALIDGPGGIGKTALAIRAAHLAPADSFERKIFITAKVRELTPKGEKPLTDFTRPNYLQMLNELAIELGEGDIQKTLPEQRANALRLALTNRKTLLVFDNLETLDESERTRLYQFLARLPEGNKAIVTSRRRDRDNVAAHLIRLDRMELEEALHLISELAKNNQALNKAGREERATLYEITNGNPLLITWICGQLGNKDSYLNTISHASKFIEKASEENDPLEYIFGDLLETFTNSETKVLAALTYFSVPVSVKWIVEMTGLSKQAAQTALEDLANRSILTADEENHEFFLPPLTAQFIKTRRPKAVAQTGDKLIDRAYALIKQYGSMDNYKGFKLLEAEWPTIAAALPRLHTRENNQLQSICNSVVTFLEFSGKWDELIELTQQAEQKALAAKDNNNAGWRACDTGLIHYLRGQSSELLACANRAEKYWKNSGASKKATIFRLHGLSYELEQNYSAANNAYIKAVELWKSKSSAMDSIGAVYLDLGYIQQMLGEYNVAKDNFEKALRIAQKIKDPDFIASALGCIASLSLEMKDWANALTLAHKALALNEKVGSLRGISVNCIIIASVLLQQGKASEALPYALRSVDIFTSLRQQNNLKEAREILKECEARVQIKSEKQ